MTLADRIRTLTPQQRRRLLERLSALEDASGAQKELVAYVMFRSGMGTPVEELRRHAATQLPEFMVPQHIVPLPALPLHPNGKVNRQALPEPESALAKTPEPARVPNETESRLARLWSDVLHVENVGLDDNFFQLGGHSLLALQLMARVREAFKADLPIKALFSSPTITGLAHAIDSHSCANGPIRRITRRDNPGSPSRI